MYYGYNFGGYSGEVPLWVEIAAYLIMGGLLIVFVRSLIKKMQHRTFVMEGKVSQKMDSEDQRGRLLYEITITRANGETQRYRTDKQLYDQVNPGSHIRAVIRNEQIIRIESIGEEK